MYRYGQRSMGLGTETRDVGLVRVWGHSAAAPPSARCRHVMIDALDGHGSVRHSTLPH